MRERLAMSDTILLRPVAPDLEPKLRSIHSQHASKIKIINETDENYQVFWLSYEGKRSRCHADLPAKGFFEGQTFSTHPFLLSDDAGNVRAIFVAEAVDCVAHLQSRVVLNPATDSESDLRSLQSYQPSTLKIINQTDTPYQVFWLDFDGKRQRRDSDLPARGQFEQYTYATHPFIVTDATGAVRVTFIARAADCTAYVQNTE
jgi:hypothetical protein